MRRLLWVIDQLGRFGSALGRVVEPSMGQPLKLYDPGIRMAGRRDERLRCGNDG